jgi:hypothetical protein
MSSPHFNVRSFGVLSLAHLVNDMCSLVHSGLLPRWENLQMFLGWKRR